VSAPESASARWRHDITNQIGIILGFAELLLDEMDAADPKRADVQEIFRAAHRALDLVQQAKVDVGEEPR
jgi:signal transduction histidine kinase